MDVDAGVLESVVERALETTPVRLVQWSAEEIFAGDGQGLGVFRVTGSAQAGNRLRDWSVILKVLPDESTAAMNGWSLAVREPLAYDSGLLDSLPKALGAPHRLGHTKQGGHHYLWLEDLGPDDVPWSLHDYAYAARQLGRFNGAYLTERPLPAAEWLSRDWLRSWLAEGAAAIDELPRHRAHPLVGRIYPAELSAELTNLWKCRDILLAALDRLPQVLCHHDAFRRNLFLRSGRLLAVDWAFLGVGPLGAELAPLVTGSAAFLGIACAQWVALEHAAVDAYCQGLVDAGWHDPEEQVRFGYAASSALRYWPGVVRLVLPTLLDETAQRRTEDVLGTPFDQIIEVWTDLPGWQARLAHEALMMVHTVH